MNTLTTKDPRGGAAIQLMVGRDQEAQFGEPRILAVLTEALETLAPRELMLSIHDPRGPLARKIVETCQGRGVPVSVWTMVFADRDEALPALPLVQTAQGATGYGRRGAWEGLGKGEERFLFACPTALLADNEGPKAAVQNALDLGAAGLFLDRIRLPSPANGQEFFGSCGCPLCRSAFEADTHTPWPDLAALVVRHALKGAEGVAPFLREGGPALNFRSRQVTAVVARYARAAHQAGLRVGLDLFAPALAGLVGQDYRALAPHADFIKPMLYCHAQGPAGLPLEFRSFLAGLEAAGVPTAAAVAFTAGLTGVSLVDLQAVRQGASFPAATAATEMDRALAMTNEGGIMVPEVYAGIELVDHPDYTTRIDASDCAAYLSALEGQSLAVCWNLLYVPREHLQAVARKGEVHR